MNSEYKKEVIAICFVILFSILMFLIKNEKESQIDKNRRFVLGAIWKTESLTNGFLYTIKYEYEGKSYQTEFTGLRKRNDSLIYLKISSTSPQNSIILYSEQVDSCLHTNMVPRGGWLSIPKCKDLFNK